MRFQLENLKTARGLNKKAVKSNVPIHPPPSSTPHSSLLCSCPSLPRVPQPAAALGLAHPPGLQPSGAAVQVSAAACTRWNTHQSITALHQEKHISNRSSSPCSPLRQTHERSLFHLLGSGFGLLCFLQADEETNKFWEHMYSWLESLKFIAAVLLLLLWTQSQSLVLSPDFTSGEFMFAAD